MKEITVIGGGVAGLTAAITCAERGHGVTLFEAHDQLGGRARSTDGQYKANLGPHAIYNDGVLWGWLRERDLLPPVARPMLRGLRFHADRRIRRTPPRRVVSAILRLRGKTAPAEQSFRAWATEHSDAAVARQLASLAGVYTFHHDPGELSAAFVWERTVRLLLRPTPSARFPIGGWTAVVESLERHARSRGVKVVTGERVDVLPGAPVIIATELRDCAKLLADDTLQWPSGRTVCLDLGLRRRRGDPWVISDLDSSGWAERYSAQDPTVAPAGEDLVQAQMPIRPDETPDDAAIRLEQMLDRGFRDWSERVTWRRRQVMDGRSGALDPPGMTWQQRPAIDRGDGVFLCGDQVAAPGVLAEVSLASAITAAELAIRHAAARPARQRVRLR
jgi:phytoene dehydrogenase-like protein